MIEVRVKLVGLGQRDEQRIVVLEEVGGDRYLSMPVSALEAEAIGLQPQDEDAPGSPLIHDLLLEVVGRFGGKLRRAIITDLRHETFYAALELEGADDQSPLSAARATRSLWPCARIYPFM